MSKQQGAGIIDHLILTHNIAPWLVWSSFGNQHEALHIGRDCGHTLDDLSIPNEESSNAT